jgi:type VI secretion system protein ImpF
MTSTSTTDVRLGARLPPPLMHVFRSAHCARKEEARAEARRRSLGVAGDAALERKIRPQRSPITERELKVEVERDVDALMNHVSLDSTIDLEEFPHVQKSILNFGFPDVVHRSLDELQAFDLDREIVSVLEQYELRFVTGTVRVARDASIEPGTLELRYVVDAHLLCRPLNIPIEFVAKFDVATGKLDLVRR